LIPVNSSPAWDRARSAEGLAHGASQLLRSRLTFALVEFVNRP
jgi:hypothetical protein